MKLDGKLISETLVEVEKVTGVERGLVMVRSCEMIFLTVVLRVMVSIIPEEVDLNVTL